MQIMELSTEVLVIGGGGAGVKAAIAACEAKAGVLLVCKGLVGKSGSTPLASWGFAAALGTADSRDSSEQHCLDTVKSGRKLANPKLAAVLAGEAVACLEELVEYGLPLEYEEGVIKQLRVPGETYPRSVIVHGGGKRIMQVLKTKMKQLNIDCLEDFVVTKLLVEENRVAGAMGISLRDGAIVLIRTKSVVLAGGGYGYLWATNDNPPHNTGDAYHLAYEAGAKLEDMEMVQYYPTVILHPQRVKGVLVDYEACLEPHLCDGRLVNGCGQPLFDGGHLPARDELIRRMFEEIQAGRGSSHGGIYLDFSQSRHDKAAIDARLEKLVMGYSYVKGLGVDMVAEPLEMIPMIHYTLGGVMINEEAAASVDGLFAAGEAAGNIHGANRIAGNALTETQSFGKVAGLSAARYAQNSEQQPFRAEEAAGHADFLKGLLQREKDENEGKAINPLAIKSQIQAIMDRYMGYGKEAARIREALALLQQIKKEQLPLMKADSAPVMSLLLLAAGEAYSMLNVAEMICRAALKRQESRGHHFRRDYPQQNSGWDDCHTVIQKLEQHMNITLSAPAGREKPGTAISGTAAETVVAAAETVNLAKQGIEAIVFRFDPASQQAGRWQSYSIPADEPQTILNLLRYIQQTCDSSLSYRDYQCHQGSCTSCVVEADGVNVRGCCTMVRPGDTVRIGPMKGKKVIKDLTTEI
ncbi:MAG: FAD-binding protein [Clostridiales bacterium]